jgi:serine/threonine protein kinase
MAQEGSLDNYITRAPEVTVPCVVGWMIDTAHGLWHLHHSGATATLHRDLKPDNLLVVLSLSGSPAHVAAVL